MIALIDYGAGNLGSLGNLFKKLGIPYLVASKEKDLSMAKAVILPGVGAAKAGMDNLKKTGLDKAIIKSIRKGVPFLGICLGMQLLFDYSEEGAVGCLGLVPGTVKKFRTSKKIPQIGWNQVAAKKDNFLFDGIKVGSYFYFVNSYYCLPVAEDVTVATTEYGEIFASVIAKDNIVATQFHPEKSGENGLKFIKNFLNKYI